MSNITRTEYEAIRADLIERQTPNFTRLCTAAEKVLRPYVTRKAYQLADDIMQEIHLRLLKYAVTAFFLRSDIPEEKKDAVLLTKWMYTVARNAINTATSDASRHPTESLTLTNEDGEEFDVPVGNPSRNDQPGYQLEQRESIREVISFILSGDSKPHIILSCLMVEMYTLLGYDRIDAQHRYTEKFGGKTLDEVYRAFRRAMRSFSWLEISGGMLQSLEAKLDQPEKGRRNGSCLLQDYAMKKGLLNSCSDWLNRMDARVRSSVEAPSDDLFFWESGDLRQAS